MPLVNGNTEFLFKLNIEITEKFKPIQATLWKIYTSKSTCEFKSNEESTTALIQTLLQTSGI